MKTSIVRFKSYLQRRYPERSTAKHYISDLNIFKQFVGQKSAREIKVKTIDAFIQAQQTEMMKPATVNRRLSAISTFFEFLIVESEDRFAGDGWFAGGGRWFWVGVVGRGRRGWCLDI